MSSASPGESDARQHLRALLSEPSESVQVRERETFAQHAEGREGRIVLFGAGGLGRRTVAGLRRAGIEPVALVDNNPDLWGTEIDEIDVLSPAEAGATYGTTCAFVVTIWGAGSPHRFAHTRQQLESLGCDVVVPPAWLFWRYAEHLLPFYALDLPSNLLEQSAEVARCFDLFADDQSKIEFVRQIQWRLTGDPGCLGPPVREAQYLVSDLSTSLDREVVLDCGAYDGDTLRSWLDVRGPSFEAYLAMEPDPISRQRLEDSLRHLQPDVASRVRLLPYSVAGYTGTATFVASGSLSSSLGTEDGIAVSCITLDDLEPLLEGVDPTFLKMDVEGAELDALEGGQHLLKRTRPLLTIAVYHRQDHLWKIPQYLNKLWSEYRFFLRPHNEEGWDLILYCVPRHRVRHW